MGWFWADPQPRRQAPCRRPRQPPPAGASPQTQPPPSCPMRNKRTVDTLNASSCPVRPAPTEAPEASQQQSALSRLNPLNYMFRDLSQAPAPNQSVALPTSREESTIPKGAGSGNWEYPSPQQMYNALLRKGYIDTDATAVESMVAVHNFLNEGAWAEIVQWERLFGRGLARGWEVCRRGEDNVPETLGRLEAQEGGETKPTLVRFQGRPTDMTPKAAMIQAMAWLYPAKFGAEPPFDRHDWYVSRSFNGQQREIRYVIDYYAGPPEPTGDPVFYLDVRPAMTPTSAVERLMRWGGDVWWRGSGGEAREEKTTETTPRPRQ